MPIFGVTGLPGAGKTYFLTWRMFWQKRRNPDMRLVSNYPLCFPWGSEVEFIERLPECFKLRDCTLLLDEMHLWAPSREWQQHGAEFAEWISQLRKRRVELYYTTQDMSGVEKLVRDRTMISYHVTSLYKLGWFAWRGFFGPKATEKKKYTGGVYPFVVEVADCYQTEWLIK